MITFGDSYDHGTRYASYDETHGTFRAYDGREFIGYVLTMAKPGEGPHWTRPLGYQGRTPGGTVAEWAPGKDEAVAALLEAHRTERPGMELSRRG